MGDLRVSKLPPTSLWMQQREPWDYMNIHGVGQNTETDWLLGLMNIQTYLSGCIGYHTRLKL